MGFGEGREKLFSRKVFPPFPNASVLFALTQLQHRHAADEQHHAEPRAGLEPLPEQEPAADGRPEDAETAPHGVGHREIHVAHGERQGVKGQPDHAERSEPYELAPEPLRFGKQQVGHDIQQRGNDHRQQRKRKERTHDATPALAGRWAGPPSDVP